MGKIRVAVLKEDIQNGQKGSFCKCPVALAVGRALRKLGLEIEDSSGVDADHAMVVTKMEERKLFYLSRAARRFIRAFDDGKKMKPFTFIMEEKL